MLYVAVSPPEADVIETVAVVDDVATTEIVGVCGFVVAVTPVEADDAADVPYGLVAETVYV